MFVALLCSLLLAQAWLPYVASTQERSHYEVLGLDPTATLDDIRREHKKLAMMWHPDKNPSAEAAHKFVEIQHAYEVLSDDEHRRAYDLFQVDGSKDPGDRWRAAYRQRMEEQSDGEPVPRVVYDDEDEPKIPDIPSKTHSLGEHNFFDDVILSDHVWLIQTFSKWDGSCQKFAATWERLADELAGIAQLARVDFFADERLAALLAESSRATNRQTLRRGLPAIVGFARGCRHISCLTRFRGPRTFHGILEWVADRILRLPQLPSISLQNLQTFLKSMPPHKVAVIAVIPQEISDDEYVLDKPPKKREGNQQQRMARAPVYLRQAVLHYNQFCVFAIASFKEEERAKWEEAFSLPSAPALVFVKEPGTNPVAFLGTWNNLTLHNIMAEHMNHELRQLRSVTVGSLNCELPPYLGRHRFCAILAGDPGLDGHAMDSPRGVLRKVQATLAAALAEADAGVGGDKGLHSAPLLSVAASLLRSKRLSLSWLDARKQPAFFRHLAAADASREGDTSAHTPPRLFLVRFGLPSASAGGSDVGYEARRAMPKRHVAEYRGELEPAAVVRWIDEVLTLGERELVPEGFHALSSPAPPLAPEENAPWIPPLHDHIIDFVVTRNEIFYERLVSLYFIVLEYVTNPMFFPALGVSIALVCFYHNFIAFPAPSKASPHVGQRRPTPVEATTTSGVEAPGGEALGGEKEIHRGENTSQNMSNLRRRLPDHKVESS